MMKLEKMMDELSNNDEQDGRVEKQTNNELEDYGRTNNELWGQKDANR